MRRGSARGVGKGRASIPPGRTDPAPASAQDQAGWVECGLEMPGFRGKPRVCGQNRAFWALGNGVSEVRIVVSEGRSGVASPGFVVCSPRGGVLSPSFGVPSPSLGAACPNRAVSSPRAGDSSPNAGVPSRRRNAPSPRRGGSSPSRGENGLLIVVAKRGAAARVPQTVCNRAHPVGAPFFMLH